MKLDVLVVDDQLDSQIKTGKGYRRNDYKSFATKFNNIDKDFKITLDFAENPIDFNSKIRNNHYHAIILDAVLNQEGIWKAEDFTITEALKDINRHASEIPIAIVSSQWDSSNSKQITEAWHSPNCRTFLHWRDITQETGGQFGYAWVALRNMIADKIELDITSTFDHDESIRILHISDIQIGGFDLDHAKAEIKTMIDKVLIHWKDKRPAFIALTGDVAEFGDPKQYEDARGWINYLLIELSSDDHKLTQRNVLYVPGNHDVNLPLAAAARVQFNKDNIDSLELDKKVQHEELLHYAYTPFRNFLSAISDCPLLETNLKDRNFAWVEERFRHLGVVFYGINTAQPANAFGIPARQVNSQALTSIRKELERIIKKFGDTKPVIIGLGHHCPVSSSEDRAVKNPEVFANFFQSGVRTALFLHGHTHENEALYTDNGNFRLVRNCAATLTKDEKYRPKDSPRGFTLLELKREQYKVKELEIASFGWINNTIRRVDDSINQRYELHTDGMFKKNI